MRITVIIFSVLVAQGSASFFSELSNSFTAVRASVEKLISDAASDIKETIDCTVFAVQQAFSAEATASGNYNKCQTKQPEDVILIPPSIEIYIAPISPINQPMPPVQRRKKPRNRKKNKVKITQNTKDFSTLEKDVQHVERSLDGETALFTNMSSTFEHEFYDLSKRAEDDFAKMEYENKLSLETIIKEIDKLQVEQEIHQTNTDDEIRKIFEILLSKTQKSNMNEFDLRNEIKLALSELEQSKNKTNAVQSEFEHWKADELKYLNDIKDILKENKQTTVSPITESVKIMSTPAATLTTAETFISKVTVITTEETIAALVTTTKPASPSKTTPVPSMDYESLVSQDKETLEQAEKLIAESRKQAALLDDILKNIDKTAINLFDDPELLGW